VRETFAMRDVDCTLAVSSAIVETSAMLAAKKPSANVRKKVFFGGFGRVDATRFSSVIL